MLRSRTRRNFRITAVATSILALGVILTPWFSVEQTAKRVAGHRRSHPQAAFAHAITNTTSTTRISICDQRARLDTKAGGVAAIPNVRSRNVFTADAETTSTTLLPSTLPSCFLRVRLDETVAVGALQFRVDYSASRIQFIENGSSGVNCAPLIGDFSAFNIRDAERALDGAIIDIEGFDGPADLAECEFIPDLCAPFPIDGLPEGVTLVPTDASTPALSPISPLPALSGSTRCLPFATTTTTLPPGACGAPVTGSVPPVTTDVLRILRAAIGLDACAACRCDVDSDGSVDARDARRALLASLNLGDGLICPGC
jgi:hypothetical protein